MSDPRGIPASRRRARFRAHDLERGQRALLQAARDVQTAVPPSPLEYEDLFERAIIERNWAVLCDMYDRCGGGLDLLSRILQAVGPEARPALITYPPRVRAHLLDRHFPSLARYMRHARDLADAAAADSMDLQSESSFQDVLHVQHTLRDLSPENADTWLWYVDYVGLRGAHADAFWRGRHAGSLERLILDAHAEPVLYLAPLFARMVASGIPLTIQHASLCLYGPRGSVEAFRVARQAGCPWSWSEDPVFLRLDRGARISDDVYHLPKLWHFVEELHAACGQRIPTCLFWCPPLDDTIGCYRTLYDRSWVPPAAALAFLREHSHLPGVHEAIFGSPTPSWCQTVLARALFHACIDVAALLVEPPFGSGPVLLEVRRLLHRSLHTLRRCGYAQREVPSFCPLALVDESLRVLPFLSQKFVQARTTLLVIPDWGNPRLWRDLRLWPFLFARRKIGAAMCRAYLDPAYALCRRRLLRDYRQLCGTMERTL